MEKNKLIILSSIILIFVLSNFLTFAIARHFYLPFSNIWFFPDKSKDFCLLPKGIKCELQRGDNSVDVTLKNYFGYDMSGVKVAIGKCGVYEQGEILNGEEARFLVKCLDTFDKDKDYMLQMNVTYVNRNTGTTHTAQGSINFIDPYLKEEEKCEFEDSNLGCSDLSVTHRNLTIVIEDNLKYDSINLDDISAQQCVRSSPNLPMRQKWRIIYSLNCGIASSVYNGKINVTYSVPDTGKIFKVEGSLTSRVQ